jgi:DNA helicase-2/ATP-dependent DNA helicase PcrA
MPAHEVALLYRSNAQSRVLETALFNAGVPYRVYGGLRFFERAEIKHALAYLRLIDNPHDDTSLLRVVNFPPRGIGARSIEALQAAAAAAGGSLHAAASAVPGKAGAHLAAFVALLDVLREGSQGQPLRQIVALVLQHSGLLAHYRAERDGSERVENLEELLNAAESFVLQQGFGRDAVALPLDETAVAPDSGFDEASGETLSPLQAFLSHAALEAGDNQAQSGQDAVQLMTVHAAKGLEFDAVFITGLEEGLFPHDNSSASAQALEEERRLMYVAITRARQRLYLSFAQTRMLHGQTRYSMRSRFLEELPEAALKWLTPRARPRAEPAWSEGYRGAWEGFDAPGRGRARDDAGRVAWSGGQAARPRADRPDTGRLDEHARRAAQRFDRGIPWRIGQGVAHARFGEGVIVAIEGAGEDARVQVDFGRAGVKWLALSVAKLQALG